MGRVFAAVLLVAFCVGCQRRVPAVEGLKRLCPDAKAVIPVREADREAVVAFTDPNDDYRDHLVRLTYDSGERTWVLATPPDFNGELDRHIWHMQHQPCLPPASP